MADNSELDISQLSPAQQAALQQYTDVTSQEIKDAIPLLQRSQWNVQVSWKLLAVFSCQPADG
jgi:FAS-associated factor 2